MALVGGVRDLQKEAGEIAPKSTLTSVDLFSGCGGLTEGLTQAGYEVVSAVELDKKAVATYKLNHPNVNLHHVDIKNLSPEVLMAEAGLMKGELFLLAGCPPCQGFSRLRTRNGKNIVEDVRNDLIFDFLRFVEGMLPKRIMMENVPGLEQDQRFVYFKARLEELGYFVTCKVVNASDYGVPQRRKRIIVLASYDSKPCFPKVNAEKITVRDAIGNIDERVGSQDGLHTMPEKRSENVKKIISMIPKDGGSRHQLPEKYHLKCFKKSGGFRDVYGRMSWSNVSPTITSGCSNPSKGRFLHPEKNRTITLREAAVLQGFPYDYKFLVEHGKQSIALMIGNALPPPLIKIHAQALLPC
ncbi:DNA cytosine methyltransferase [Vreelandella alkaliphila]|uniref:DNA (cytosine-5-)-methyltransferase n=1 Tax=Vreelandella alkaliphila TaxID=272774 RepID=A0AAJ2RUT8_9GAMM|nr:DNA cytosine methyltransferase [Halomonas alkaliphila]MDX5976864.1 DNA cytosine methyltransferase [Halomonas alkaliphila]